MRNSTLPAIPENTKEFTERDVEKNFYERLAITWVSPRHCLGVGNQEMSKKDEFLSSWNDKGRQRIHR